MTLPLRVVTPLCAAAVAAATERFVFDVGEGFEGEGGFVVGDRATGPADRVIGAVEVEATGRGRAEAGATRVVGRVWVLTLTIGGGAARVPGRGTLVTTGTTRGEGVAVRRCSDSNDSSRSLIRATCSATRTPLRPSVAEPLELEPAAQRDRTPGSD
jgi:hypothetical protein